jgi:hypothetical protein
VFKQILFETIGEVEPLLRFTGEEVRRIADYARSSYFKHLRLYDFVFNNKTQLNEVKRLTLNTTAPIIAPTLSDALLIAQEEALTYEDDLEVIRHDVVVRKEAVLAENRRREEAEARKAQGIKDAGEDEDGDPTLKDEDLKNIADERLRKANIDKGTKVVINNQMNTLENNILKTMEERARQLDEKISQGAGGSAKKK